MASLRPDPRPFHQLAKLILDPRNEVRSALALSAVEDLAIVSLGICAPLLLKILVDDMTGSRNDPGRLSMAVILFVATWSAASVIGALKPLHAARIVTGLHRALQTRVLRAQAPALAQGQSVEAGELLGLLERAPFHLQVVVEGILGRAFPLVIQVLVAIILIGYIAPIHDAVGLAATLSAYCLAGQLRMKAFDVETKRVTASAAHASQTLADVVRNAPRIVFNANLEAELLALDGLSRVKAQVDQRMSKHLASMGVLQAVVLGLGVSVLLILSGQDVLAHRATIGDFVLLQAYALRLAAPLTGLGFLLRQAQISMASLAEVFALSQSPSQGRSALVDGHESGAPAIKLEHVGYTYPSGHRAVARVCAEIPAGAFVAVVGANGSGKSTLAKLVAGVLTPTEGRVYLNGQAPGARSGKPMPRHLLYVPQFIGLFNRSLRENGVYPPSTLSDQALLDRLEAWTFEADGGPVDLDRKAGDHGAKLSGGQIQKLELARLTGIDTDVLILDESTSALDQNVEARVMSDLRRHLAKTTILMVTHRVTLAAQADLVFFVEAGVLAGHGPHADLIGTCVAYQRFWASENETPGPAPSPGAAGG